MNNSIEEVKNELASIEKSGPDEGKNSDTKD